MFKAKSFVCRGYPPITYKNSFSRWHTLNKPLIYPGMAEAAIGELENSKVKKYFESYLEVDNNFVESLYSKKLVSCNEKEKILRESNASSKARTCYNILVKNVSDDKIIILNDVLRTHGFKTVDDMKVMVVQHDLQINLGRTVPLTVHTTTIDTENSQTNYQMLTNSVDDYNIHTDDSIISVYDIQDGCIHIFLHSRTPFYPDLCEEDNCRKYIEKYLAMPNVKETLESRQTITVVIRKNAFSIPLNKGHGKHFEFSKIQVLKIYRYFIDNELKEYLHNLTEIFGKPEISMGGQDWQPTDILLEAMEGESNDVWLMFMRFIIKRGKNKLADRLESMICAECYRTTIIRDFRNVAEEIDTCLMEETFKGKQNIPKVVLEDCLLSKGKLPRLERAKYFLEYVLLKGEILLAFADTLSSRSKIVLNFSPCENHGGESLDTSSSETDKEFTFTVCKDKKDHFYLSGTQQLNAVEPMHSSSLNGYVNGGPGIHSFQSKRIEQTDLDTKISIKKEKLLEHDKTNDIKDGKAC